MFSLFISLDDSNSSQHFYFCCASISVLFSLLLLTSVTKCHNLCPVLNIGYHFVSRCHTRVMFTTKASISMKTSLYKRYLKWWFWRSCLCIPTLREAEDIKKRWQEYTEEWYKKDLHDSDNHDGVITHLQPDIKECEVKWALGSITTNKVSGGDGISVELFQILEDDAAKCYTQYASKFGKLNSGHGTGKGHFSF